VGGTLNALQQFCGINALVYFTPSILEGLGLEGPTATLATFLIASLQLLSLWLVIRLVDSFGRKPLAYVGLGGMVFSLLCLSVSFFLRAKDQEPSEGGAMGMSEISLALGGVLLMKFFFSLSLGPLPYIITAELFPSTCRAAGVSACFFFNWSANLIVTFLTPKLISPAGRAALMFLMFAAFAIAALPFVFFFLPETKGQSLEAAGSAPPPGRPSASSSSAAQGEAVFQGGAAREGRTLGTGKGKLDDAGSSLLQNQIEIPVEK